MDNYVYVVQNKKRFNLKTNKYDLDFDFSQASQFGELKHLLSYEDSSFLQQPVILKLKRELLKFKENDSLLLVGEAPLIGAAMIIVSEYNRKQVPILIYDKYVKSYYRKIYKF